MRATLPEPTALPAGLRQPAVYENRTSPLHLQRAWMADQPFRGVAESRLQLYRFLALETAGLVFPNGEHRGAQAQLAPSYASASDRARFRRQADR